MIHREDVDSIAVLRMEHGKANTIDIDLFDQIDEQLDDIEKSASIQAVVLTGTGGIFSAGVNLIKVTEGGRDYLEAFLPRLSSALLRLFTLPLPVVAAVNGHAIAGGFILALAADHRVMAEGKGKVGLTELLVGVAFPVAPLEIVRYLAPGRTAENLVLSGRLMPGEAAMDLDLVDEIVPAESVVEQAIRRAAHYASIPRQAYAFSKRHLRAPAVETIERYSSEYDPQVLDLWSHPESLERIAQYLEKTISKKAI